MKYECMTLDTTGETKVGINRQNRQYKDRERRETMLCVTYL
jgi:hypothetical protein